MKLCPMPLARELRVRGSYFAMICLSLFMLALPACSITLVDNGSSTYVIAKKTGCDSTTSQAATDLRTYLQSISGATLTINSYADMSTVPAQAIVIGDLITSPTLALEQVEMKVSGSRLILRGGSSTAHRYAVFAFLEEELGCRYYSPTVEYLPSQSTITVADDYDGTHMPSFEMRYLYQQDATANATWCVKNRVNGQVTIDGTHNMFTIVPPGTYFANHPEYYPLHGGNRGYSSTSQWLCFTNPDLPQIIANYVKGRMNGTGANVIINVGQGDGSDSCECASCQAAYTAEGSAWSGVMLQCLNAAANIVAQTHPTRKMMTFAYMHTEKPPSTTAPVSNLLIRLCHWERCDLHGLAVCDEQNIFESRLDTWQSLTDPGQLYIWHYTTNFDSACAPWPNVTGLIPDIQYYWNHDVSGLFYQGVYWARGGDLSALKLYLQAKAMWDKDVDAATVYNDFLTGYYGDAGDEMDAYIDLLEGQVANWHPDGITFGIADIKANVLPDEVFAEADELFDVAEAAASAVSQTLYDRVHFDRASLLYMHTYNKQSLARISSPADRIVKLGDNAYYDWKTALQDIIGDRAVGSEFASGVSSRLRWMPQQAGSVVSIENAALKISVCPWIQGAIVGVYDKATGKELIHHARKYYDTSDNFDDTPFNGFFWGENFHYTTSVVNRESALDTDCDIETLPDGSQTITLTYGIGVGQWTPSTPTRTCTKVITLAPAAASFTVSEKRKNIDDVTKSAERLVGRLFLGGDTFFSNILVTEPDDSTATITTFPTTLDAKKVAFDNTEYGTRLELDFTDMPASPTSLTVGKNDLYSFNTITSNFDCGTFSLSPDEEEELFSVTCTVSEIDDDPAPGQEVAWKDCRNTAVDPQFGGLLYKTTGGAAYNADAVSANRMMYSDGFVEWQFATNGQSQMLGLNPTNSDDARTIQYAIRTYNSGGAKAIVWETNADCGTAQSIQPFDIFRIERVGTTIYYKKNGTTFYTSAVASSDPLMVDTCLYNTGAFNGVYHCRFSAVNVPPTVSLTAPTSGEVLITNNLTLTADAADTNGAISKVEFYDGTTKIGEDTTSPYSYDWAVPGGAHRLTAKAIDDEGGTTTSGLIGVVVWNTSDIGSVGTSGSASYSSDTFTVNGAGAGLVGSADAFHFAYMPISGDCTMIAQVLTHNTTNANARAGVMIRETLNVGAKETSTNYKKSTTQVLRTWRSTTDGTTNNTGATAATLPYWVKLVRSGNNFSSYKSSDGTTWTQVSTTLTISMTDPVYIGLVETSGVSGTVKTATFDNVSITAPTTAPTVSITSPLEGAMLESPADITITADAADSDGVVSKVEFYNGTTKLGVDSSSPYSYTWNGVTSGSYSLTAKAIDNYSASTVSDAVSIEVENLPTVSITAPTNNAVIIANNLSITADAADSDGTISKVEFYDGTTKLGEDTTSPYSYDWTVPSGSHTLTAVATDNVNGMTTSSAIAITVWNTADIGNVGATGSASYSSGTFTVNGAGAGLTGSADACRFVYMTVSGDCTMIARVVAHNTTNANARAGVMIRETLNVGSKETSTNYKKSTTQVLRTWRSTTDGTTNNTGAAAAALAYWVKLVRSGDDFSSYKSSDGTTWTQVSTSLTISMTDPVYIGLVETSGVSGTLKTATFDNVSITTP